MAIFTFQTNGPGYIENGAAVIKPADNPAKQNYLLDMPGRTPHLTTLSSPENQADAKYLGDGWFKDMSGIAASSGDVSGLSSANAAAVVSYAGVTNKCNTIYGVAFSYNGAPTGGTLTVQDGTGVFVFNEPVTAAGIGFIDFPKGLRGTAGTQMIVTLGAGGAGVQGQVTVKGHRYE